MDFTLNEEQTAISELAGTILGDLCTADALRAHERAGGATHAGAWKALASADLLGIALPEPVGGGGFGVLEACLVAEQVGRHVAPVPFASTIAAALLLAELDAAAHADLLGRVVKGDAVLACATEERSAVTAGSGTLQGERNFVPWAPAADAALVPASGGDGRAALFLVDLGAPGVTVIAEDALAGLPQGTIELRGTAAVEVGGAEAVARLVDLETALACATVAGVCEGAIRITAAYVSEREQFGARIGTFQAVAQRMADSYIDTQGAHLTARQAAWRLASGLPAAEELHIAKFWAAEAGHRVGHAAQHLHGGIGVDTDYPIHRYFRWLKSMELQLGTGTDHLRGLGALLAAEPV